MASDSEGEYEPSDAESVASEAPSRVPEDNQSRPGLASSRLAHGTPKVALGSSAATPQYAQSPRKRRATHTEPNVPLKRMRSAFNAGYLDLLNQDISDAAAAALRKNQNNAHAALEPSQIGTVYWRASEKDAFFSALGRLGRDNHAGIAARIGSKSPLEVAQFVTLLSECEKARKDERVSWYETLRPIDIPAAAEISHECCVALNGIADDVSIRQETHEQTQEEKRWGEQNWLVTQSLVGKGNPSTAKKLEGELPFADLFVLPNWLKLSERVFMNSSIPDCNWRQVSEEPPAIRATALSDLLELAKSFTKRLVATTLFMSESRIKARRTSGPRAKQAVKARDVHAAVESLNLKSNSREFWARAARRLRLDVQGDATRTDGESQPTSPSSTDDESADSEDETDRKSDANHNLSYDDVEAAFGIVQGRHQREQQQLTTELSSQYVIDEDDTSSSEDEATEADAPVDGGEEDGGIGQQDLKDSDLDAPLSDNLGGRNPSLDWEAIDHDLNEAVNFSAELVETTRAREGLRNRITAEHVMEAEAAAADAQFNAREEAVLWSVIKQQQSPPESNKAASAAKREKSSDYERDGTSKAAAGFTNRATMEPGARNWREGFRYIAEWETYGTFPAHES
ncbi:DNA-binding protein [Apiospora arundinis]